MKLPLRFARLEPHPDRLSDALALLSRDERHRAGAFRRQRDHDRFVLARALLRRLLGTRLGVDPGLLRFRYGPAGKPVLDWPESDLQFNLSHAGDGVLIGCCPDREVGVDLEAIVPARVSLAAARRVLTHRVVARLEAVGEAERAALFFRAWTRMEARLKATGAGLGSPGRGGTWIRSLSPAPGYVAAVAVGARRPAAWSPALSSAWQLVEMPPATGPALSGPPEPAAGSRSGEPSGPDGFHRALRCATGHPVPITVRRSG